MRRRWTGAPRFAFRQLVRFQNGGVFFDGRAQCRHIRCALPQQVHCSGWRIVHGDQLAALDQLILVCTRFEGLDQRAVRLYVDEELSVGDAVLSGGELPALCLVDAVCRWLPGVLGNEASAAADSFATGLLDHPHYTRPAVFEGLEAPAVLLGGDHEAVRLWRLCEAMARTRALRPELWRAFLARRLEALPRADQWCAWQAEHPEDRGRAKPRGWKGWKYSLPNPPGSDKL